MKFEPETNGWSFSPHGEIFSRIHTALIHGQFSILFVPGARVVSLYRFHDGRIIAKANVFPLLHNVALDRAKEFLTEADESDPASWDALEAKEQWLGGHLTTRELDQKTAEAKESHAERCRYSERWRPGEYSFDWADPSRSGYVPRTVGPMPWDTSSIGAAASAWRASSSDTRDILRDVAEWCKDAFLSELEKKYPGFGTDDPAYTKPKSPYRWNECDCGRNHKMKHWENCMQCLQERMGATESCRDRQ